MLIKRNIAAETASWLGVVSIIPAGMIIRRPEDWIWAAALEAIALIVFSGLMTRLKEREILYESNENQITVTGSKESLYDPDTVSRCDIQKAAIRGRKIELEMTDGRIIMLDLPPKHRSAVLADINSCEQA